MAAKEDESDKETVTISRKKYNYLMYCQEIVLSSVRSNVEVVQLTKKICEKLRLMDEYYMIHPEKTAKKSPGRPKKDKEDEINERSRRR